jgi:hypothetical protein
LHELIAAHCEEPDQVMIGIESDRPVGLGVDGIRISGVGNQPDGGGPLPRPPPRLRREI